MHIRLLAVLLAGVALAAAQAPAPAPAPALATPLPLPADPAVTCTAEAMLEVTSSVQECSDAIMDGEESVECCTALAERYGPNSTAPTANCFCVPQYWSELSALSDISYARWGRFLDKCSKVGHPIPYFQDGEGPCGGVPPETEQAESSEAQVLPMRTFSAWVAGLGSDPWSAASFAFGILSAIGGCIMAWSFLFDAYADLRSYVGTAKGTA